MRKQVAVKTAVAGVFPLIGSPEEGRNKKIRTLKTVGFQLTPQQAIETATALLTKAQAAHNGEKHTVVNIIGRRKEGESILTIENVLAPPVRRKKPKTQKNDTTQTASTDNKDKSEGKSQEGAPSKTTRKQPRSARPQSAATKGNETSDAGAAAA